MDHATEGPGPEERERDEKKRQMIGSIKQAKRDRRRYLLFAEAEEPLLSVHEDILVRYRLTKGQWLSADEIEEIRLEDQRYSAYITAISYLGLKPRTRKQIQQYLMRKQFEENGIQYALDRLENEKYVDDGQYAHQLAASRMRSGLKGRLWIKQELQQNGVPPAAAAKAIADIDRESELDAARTLAEKKWRTLKGELPERRRKLMSFILRRGFPGDIAREAMKSLDLSGEDELFCDEDGLLLDN